MNRIKENNTKVNFIYFKLDIKSDIMYEIQGEGKINECIWQLLEHHLCFMLICSQW